MGNIDLPRSNVRLYGSIKIITVSFHLNEFCIWSTLRGWPFLLQVITGLGIPVVSHGKVVWTFTVTVMLTGPGATDGGTMF